jgi:hypothetical protein
MGGSVNGGSCPCQTEPGLTLPASDRARESFQAKPKREVNGGSAHAPGYHRKRCGCRALPGGSHRAEPTGSIAQRNAAAKCGPILPRGQLRLLIGVGRQPQRTGPAAVSHSVRRMWTEKKIEARLGRPPIFPCKSPRDFRQLVTQAALVASWSTSSSSGNRSLRRSLVSSLRGSACSIGNRRSE